jgi:hypothetical protein
MASHTEASVNIDIKTHWAIAKLFRLIVLRKVWNMGDLLGNDRQSVLSEMTNFDKNRLDFDFLFKMSEETSRPGTLITGGAKEASPKRPQPTEIMRAFDCGLLPGECIPDHELLAVNGWLRQDGELLACAWQQHTKTVNDLGFETERDAVVAGYVKLSNMVWQLGRHYAVIVLTDAQLATILDWHIKNAISDDYFQYQMSRFKK